MQTQKQNANDSGCFSGMLRMILCRNGASTKASDCSPKIKPNSDVLFDSYHNIEDQTRLDHTQVATGSDKPGIVARLMGLESLPDSKLTPKLMVKSPDSVFRSRSVNFMDYLLEVDLDAGGQGHQIHHRRVKTSVSFREVPGALHQQQQDMVVLYLDNMTKELTDTIPKPEEKNGSTRKEKRAVNLIDEPGRHQHSRNSNCSKGSGEFIKQGENKIRKKQVKVMEEKERMSELKFTVKKMKRKKMKRKKKKIRSVHKQVSETSSSPVSVLDMDYNDRVIAQRGSVQANKKRGTISSAKKKEEATVEMEGSKQHPSSIVDRKSGVDYCLKVVGTMWGLLEQDIKMSSNRVTVKEDFEGIGLKIERAIMDHMIQEAVDELNLC